jgi:MFS family permease
MDPACEAGKAPICPLPRTPLPGVLQWAQICLLVLFAADTYTYALLDTLLSRYLGKLGFSQLHASLAYATYGLLQFVGSVALLLLHCSKAFASATIKTQFGITVIAVTVALGSTLFMLAAPASYPLLVLSRGLQGAAAATYSIYSMSLLVRCFPAAWLMRGVAFMNAGELGLLIPSPQGQWHTIIE